MLKQAGVEKKAEEAVTVEDAKQAEDARRARARRHRAQQLIMPSEEEEAATTAAALSDPDAQPLTDSQLAQLRPARRRGRPFQEVTKVPTSIRFDIEVLDSFKALGDGWQTRMNDVLRTYLIENKQLARRYHATVQVRGNELQMAGEFLVVALNDREAVHKVRQHLRDTGRDEDARREVCTVDLGSAMMRELPLIV